MLLDALSQIKPVGLRRSVIRVEMYRNLSERRALVGEGIKGTSLAARVAGRQAQVRAVRANGVEFQTIIAGAGEQLALCLHGFPEHAWSWRDQIPALSALGFTVWAPNLRGYGESHSPLEPSAYRIDRLIEDVIGLIEAADLGPATLIGHDWGAFLAWMVAMRRPDLVARLVVLNMPHPACFLRELRSPGQALRSWYMMFFRIPRLPEWLLERNHGAGVVRLIEAVAGGLPDFNAENQEPYRQNMTRPAGARPMLNWYRALRLADVAAELERGSGVIQAPTLIIWGQGDIALGERGLVGSEAYTPDLVVRHVEGGSHCVQQKKPARVNQLLTTWLWRTQERSRRPSLVPRDHANDDRIDM